MRALLPALLLLPLAACTGADPDMGLRSSAALLPQTTAASVPVGVALPAEAGAPLASTERAGPRSRLRRTVLRGEGALRGENFVSVETGGRAGTRTGLLRPPPVETIQAEMRAVLPGVPMRVGATMEENAGGPFGYALGRAGGTACIYAWQWLDLGRPGGFLAKRDPAGIRVRLCRGSRTEPLLQAVRGMTVGAGVRGGFPDASPGSDALAATGVAAGAGSDSGALARSAAAGIDDGALPAPRPHRTGTRRAAPAPTVAAAPAPPANAPAIPLPAPPSASAASMPAAPAVAPVPRKPPPPQPDDDVPLIPDPGITASTR